MTVEKHNRHHRRRMRTRRQLQDAMLELVLEKGFESIVIQEITDRADVGRGTFYFHFDDKEDILWSVVEDRIHLTEQEVMAQFDGELPDQAEFYGYVNMFRHVDHNKSTYQAILGWKGSQEIASRVKAYLVSETKKDIERFGIYSDIGQPSDLTAEIVVGLLVSLAIWWLETPNEYTPLQMGEIIYRTLHHREPPAGTWQFGAPE
jgi:AcrR family transcriptional regulator